MTRYVTFVLLLATLVGCAGPFQIRKTKWTVEEVKTWYAWYSKNEPGGDRGIIYQGSDSKYHHFIARVRSVDNWAIMEVKKEDLKVPQELRYSRASSAQFSYYVDPSRDFARVTQPK
jgi:hypothetical protein